MDQGIEAVADPALVSAARFQARRVHLLAAVTAAVITVLLTVMPQR